MHTGYDNFWKYQNIRHEPVLNLPKNDQELTDIYKHMHSGGRPSQMNSYISPQNNVPSSHQNNQHRAPDSDCLWPTSACSMPLNFPHLRNVHPQEAFLTKSNNVCYLSPNSQLQQNYNFRCLKNSKVNISQEFKGNNNNNNNNLNNSESPRIRIKDVFSINLSPTVHPQSKEQECPLNYPTVNYTAQFTSETQSEIINYRKSNVPQPLHTYYGQPTATERPPQYLHNTGSFYHQNAQYVPESQFQFRSDRPVKQNFQSEASKTNSSTLEQLLKAANSRVPKGQMERSHSNSMYGNTRINVIPERHLVAINSVEATNNSGFRSSLEVNTGLIHETSNLNNVTQIQHQNNFARINEACLLGSSSTAATNSRGLKNVTSNRMGHSYEHISEPEDASSKISYPQIHQNISPSLSDYNSTNKNSNLSLPSLLESNDVFFDTLKSNSPINSESKNGKTSNLPETTQGNFSNSQATPSVGASPTLAQNCQSPPGKRLCPKDLLFDVNRENITKFLKSNLAHEGTLENFDAMNDMGDEIISKEEMVQEHPLNIQTLKHENYNASTESFNTGGHISEGKVLFEIIKTEKNFIDENLEDSTLEEYEAEASEKSDALTEPFDFDDREIENPFLTEVDVDEKPPSCPEKSSYTSGDVKSVKNSPTIGTVNNNTVSEEKIEEDEADMLQALTPKINYKSKINRDKLDMLIKFLKKDELLETKLKPPYKKKFGSDKNGKKEVDLNHNRRKLNKTSVVKNKNNSREMISYKTARIELTKCSSEPSQNVKYSASSYKMQERKYSNAEDRVNKIFLTEQLQEVPSKPSPQKNCGIKDEQNFISTLRALQTLQVHFCMSCELISPIESFWINVVSGELRCFNCFSKITIKNGSNLFSTRPDSPSGVVLNPIQKDQTRKSDILNEFERVRENKVKDESVGLYKVEYVGGNSVNASETSRHEIMSEEQQTRGENTKKEGIGTSQAFRKHSRSSESKPKTIRSLVDQKQIIAEQLPKINKSNEVSPKAKNSDYSNLEKKDKKGGETPNQHKKRSNSNDSRLSEEHSKREGKKDFSDKYVKKVKESHTSHKDNSGEQLIKRNPKYEPSEKSKILSPSKGNSTDQKPKPLEQGKPKNLSNLSDESKRKSMFGLNGSEKHKKTEQMHGKKRKNSDEDVGANKIRILEDCSRREQIPTNVTNVLKEDTTGPKNKILDNERQKNSTEKSRHNSFSKEGDHPKKETKKSDNSKTKDFLKGEEANQKIKTIGMSKQKVVDLMDAPRRKSKDEPRDTSVEKQKGNTSKEDSKFTTSTFQEPSKKENNGGSVATVNNDRKKAEEKEKKHSSGKTQKSSSSEKGNREMIAASTESTGHPRKSDTSSKPLKESQNKNSTQCEKLKNKDSHGERKEAKKHTKSKDNKKHDKHIKEKIDKNSGQKSDKERLEGKSNKNQTQNTDANDKQSATGKKNEIDPNNINGKLFEKLMKKTKKLSWSLLSDG